MEKGKKAVYREKISHTTKAMPYRVYRSFFLLEEDALYPHWHPEAELLFLESGELDFMVEDAGCRIRAGDAVFIPANLLHMARAAGSSGSFRALVFSTDLVAAPEEPAAFQKYVQPLLQNPMGFWLHLNGEEAWQQEVLGDLKRIFSHEEREEETELITAGLVRAVWYNLYRNHFEKTAEKRIGGRQEIQLQETLAYMHIHFQEELTLQMLADTAHMSEGQFCRTFKNLTGNTPFSYLKRYRLLKSCGYLSETDKKISEICMLCGFNNISYFNREFLKMMKVKPSVYRARCRKEERTNGFK